MQADGYGARSINSTITTLSAIFQHAVRSDLLPTNPVHGLERVPEEKKIIRVPTHEDVRLVADTIRTPAAKSAVLLAAATGMRYSELMALDWKNVKDSQIIVCQALDRDMSIKATKSRKERAVPITPDARRVLKEIGPKPSGLVLANENGNPVNRNNFNNRFWRPAFEVLEIEPFRFHDLRHLFASTMIEAGATAQQIKSWMGHGSITTTFDVYGHLLETDTTNVMEKFDTISNSVEADVIPLR